MQTVITLKNKLQVKRAMIIYIKKPGLFFKTK